MTKDDQDTLSTQIINRALEYGGSLAGIARIEDLKKCPSHTVYGVMPEFDGVGTIKVEGKKQDQVQWPDEARSAVVIAVAHAIEKPELDWWISGLKGGTMGNAKATSASGSYAD